MFVDLAKDEDCKMGSLNIRVIEPIFNYYGPLNQVQY